MTINYTVFLQVEGQGSVNLGQQLDSMTITSGSADGWEQPSPAQCQISFLGLPTMGTNSGLTTKSASWWLGRNVGILVSVTGSTPNVAFYGRVMSVDATPQDSSAETLVVTLNLQSKLGDLSNYIVTNNRAIETETQRAAGLVADGLATSWDELGVNLAWDDILTTTTWANFDSQNGINFDQHGTSTKAMVAYTSDSQALIDVMTDFAIGENGFFGERLNWDYYTITPYIHYTQSSTWAESPLLDPIDLAECGISEELGVNLNLANIYNSFTADNGTITRTFDNPASIASYGLRDMALTTQFSSANDIDTMLAQRSAGRSTPQQSLTSVTIDYDLLSSYLHIYFVGYLFCRNFVNVPEIYGGDKVYFVRGCQLTLSFEHAEATWQLTPQDQLAYFQSWALVTPTTPWSSYATATTKWSDLT